ncbi:hypothetical protein BDW66DRAFT_131730 [Aspergillus desertorum]
MYSVHIFTSPFQIWCLYPCELCQIAYASCPCASAVSTLTSLALLLLPASASDLNSLLDINLHSLHFLRFVTPFYTFLLVHRCHLLALDLFLL